MKLSIRNLKNLRKEMKKPSKDRRDVTRTIKLLQAVSYTRYLINTGKISPDAIKELLPSDVPKPKEEETK